MTLPCFLLTLAFQYCTVHMDASALLNKRLQSASSVSFVVSGGKEEH
jgi:hypothetical protein